MKGLSQLGSCFASVSKVAIPKTGDHSTLLVSFHLKRHMGDFVIQVTANSRTPSSQLLAQVYGPCILLVVISWVSFWLNREATSDRISLGITTVLTMTFMGLEARKDLPKVTYPTALDYFVFISFMYIFSTVVQVPGDPVTSQGYSLSLTNILRLSLA